MKFFLVTFSFLIISTNFSYSKTQLSEEFWINYYERLHLKSYESAFKYLEQKIKSIKFDGSNDSYFDIEITIRTLILDSVGANNFVYLDRALNLSNKLLNKLDKNSSFYNHFYPVHLFAVLLLTSGEKIRDDFSSWNKIWGENQENIAHPEMRIWFLLFEYYFAKLESDVAGADDLINKVLVLSASADVMVKPQLLIRVLSEAQLFYAETGRLLEAIKIQMKIYKHLSSPIFSSLDSRNPQTGFFFSTQLEICARTLCPTILIEKFQERIWNDLDYILENNKDPRIYYGFLRSLLFANATSGFSKNIEKLINLAQLNYNKLEKIESENIDNTFHIALAYAKFVAREELSEFDIKILKKNKKQLKKNNLEYLILETLDFYNYSKDSNNLSKKDILEFIYKIERQLENNNKKLIITQSNSKFSEIAYSHFVNLVLSVISQNKHLADTEIIFSIFRIIEKTNISKTKFNSNFLSSNQSNNYYHIIKKNYLNEVQKKTAILDDSIKIIFEKLKSPSDFDYRSSKYINLSQYKENQKILDKHLALLEINKTTKNNFLKAYNLFPKISEIENSLDKSSMLYLYQVQGNFVLSCVLLSKNSECRLRVFSELENNLYNKIQKIRNSMSFENQNEFPIIDSKNLFDLLFDREIINFDEIKNVLIVPPSDHLNIPFNALKLDNEVSSEYLGLKYNLVILPSLNLFLENKNTISNNFEYLAFGDPNFRKENELNFSENSFIKIRNSRYAQSIEKLTSLPETKEEIQSVSSLFKNKKVYYGKSASELNFRESVQDNYDVIHIATHGLTTGEFDGNLEEPALILSPVNEFYYNDGILKASEISQLDFNSDIVILSACNTAVEKESFKVYQGLNDLSLSFLNSGANKLIVSQWAVSSNETSILISNYFKNSRIHKLGENSFRESMIKVFEKQKHPKYWAPFITVGGNFEKLIKNNDPTELIYTDKNSNKDSTYNYITSNLKHNDNIFSSRSFQNKKDLKFAFSQVFKNLHANNDSLMYESKNLGNPKLVKSKEDLYLIQSKKGKELIIFDFLKNKKLNDDFNYENSNFAIFSKDNRDKEKFIHYSLTTELTKKNFDFDNIAENNKVYLLEVQNPENRIEVEYESEAKNITSKFSTERLNPDGSIDEIASDYYFKNTGLSSDANFIWVNIELSGTRFKNLNKKFSLLYSFNGDKIVFNKYIESFEIQSIYYTENKYYVMGKKEFDYHTEFQIINNEKVIFSMPIDHFNITKLTEDNDNIYLLGHSYLSKTRLNENLLKRPEGANFLFDPEMVYKYTTITNFTFVFIFDKKFKFVNKLIKNNSSIGTFTDLIFYKGKKFLYENLRDSVNNIYLFEPNYLN